MLYKYIHIYLDSICTYICIYITYIVVEKEQSYTKLLTWRKPWRSRWNQSEWEGHTAFYRNTDVRRHRVMVTRKAFDAQIQGWERSTQRSVVNAVRFLLLLLTNRLANKQTCIWNMRCLVCNTFNQRWCLVGGFLGKPHTHRKLSYKTLHKAHVLMLRHFLWHTENTLGCVCVCAWVCECIYTAH